MSLKKVHNFPLKNNNGRRHCTATKLRARNLRRAGWTHREISKELGISMGSAHLWTVGIRISPAQKQAIEQRRGKHKWTVKERKEKGKFLAKYRKVFNRQELLQEIKIFYNAHGRIPLKREFNSRRVFRSFFGSWNKAIIAAGYKPNPVYFADRVRANDGHMCDSFSEKIIDDWLYDHGVNHKRNHFYPNSKMTADFYLAKDQIFIEFFGLLGANIKYDRNHNTKLKLAKSYSLRLIPLYLNDVLQNVYPEKLQPLLE